MDQHTDGQGQVTKQASERASEQEFEEDGDEDEEEDDEGENLRVWNCIGCEAWTLYFRPAVAAQHPQSCMPDEEEEEGSI
mmetsp:Transcript_34033/g.72506  ORF Transcript_34033/g.72506 Transcript_34033/m.72506 type:complete len:80 (-) Transcript_34033:226-465(-)